MKKNIFYTMMFAISIIGTIIAFILLFPSISEGRAYGDLLETMPQDMLAAIGMVGDITNLNDYLNMNFYNSIYIYILAAFVIVLVSRLIAKPLDDTSLVYYLNSPISRVKFMLVNIGVVFSAMVAIFVSSIIGVLAGKLFIDSSTKIDWKYLFETNLVLIVIFLFFASVCFFICSLVNKNNEALVYSATIVLVEYLIDMLCKVSDKLEKIKCLTVFSIYNVDAIEAGKGWVSFGCVMLALVSLAFFAISTVIFKKKDLYI
jgi:ABC-2 type transport system permease protein